MTLPQHRFDEHYYLQAWSDVMQSVRSGCHQSGYHHWLHFGQQEGRAYRELGDSQPRGTRLPPNEMLAKHPESVVDLDFDTRRHHGFRVPSCCWQPTLDKLLAMTQSIHNGVVVEVGVFGGSTLLFLAEDLARRNVRLVGVDPWEKLQVINGQQVTRRRDEFANWLSQLRFNLEGILQRLDYKNVQLVHDFSLSAVAAFADASIDFIIIDGDHSEEAVTQDLAAWWPKLKPGGVLWGDDYSWPAVKTAADAFAARLQATLEPWNDQFILRKAGAATVH